MAFNLVTHVGIPGTSEGNLLSSGILSSSASSTYGNAFGTLGYSSTKSWRPTSTSGAYLESRLSTEHYVTAISTKGGSSGYFVRTYTVRYYNVSAASWVRNEQTSFFRYLIFDT